MTGESLEEVQAEHLQGLRYALRLYFESGGQYENAVEIARGAWLDHEAEQKGEIDR